MTDFNENPYVLVWNDDFLNSQCFSDLYQSLETFDEEIQRKEWDKSNIKDTLYLKKYISDGYFNSDYEVFDSINIAVGLSSFRYRLPKTDIQKYSKLDALDVYADATKDSYAYGKSIREILQGMVEKTYFVSALNSEMVA